MALYNISTHKHIIGSTPYLAYGISYGIEH